MDEGAGVELVVDDVVVVVEVEDAVPDPVRVADAAIAESVESLLGSVRGITNDVDADADAEGGVNVRGRGVVMGVMGAMGAMGGGGCACAAIAVLCSRFLCSRFTGTGTPGRCGKRSESREARSDRLGSVCLGRVESQAGGKDVGGLDEIRIV